MKKKTFIFASIYVHFLYIIETLYWATLSAEDKWKMFKNKLE